MDKTNRKPPYPVLLTGEVATVHGIANITEIENSFSTCETERDMLHVIADYMLGDEQTIKEVHEIITKRLDEIYVSLGFADKEDK